MLSLGSVDVLTRAQGLVDSSARRIAQSPPKPEDFVDLIQARDQFAAGIKLAHTEESLNRRLLDLLG